MGKWHGLRRRTKALSLNRDKGFPHLVHPNFQEFTLDYNTKAVKLVMEQGRLFLDLPPSAGAGAGRRSPSLLTGTNRFRTVRKVGTDALLHSFRPTGRKPSEPSPHRPLPRPHRAARRQDCFLTNHRNYSVKLSFCEEL